VPLSLSELEEMLTKYPKHHGHVLIERNIDNLLELIQSEVQSHNKETDARSVKVVEISSEEESSISEKVVTKHTVEMSRSPKSAVYTDIAFGKKLE
jgi:hypothetical protein